MIENIRIIFFGAGPHVISILELLSNHYEIPLVVTTEQEGPLISYCKENAIEFLSVSNLSDPTINSQLSTINSPVGVLAYFGLLLPKNVLNIFPLGIINTHPSLLPRYRGPTPVQTALLNGDLETGVTIIKLDNEVDHGPILAQKKESIKPNDTAEDLYAKLFKKGGEMLLEVLPKYVAGEVELKEQDHQFATFTKRFTRNDGKIDLDNPPSQELLDRMIRAYWPWPGVWSEVRNQKSEIRVKFLPNKMIQVEGKKPVSLEDFKNGYSELAAKIVPMLGH